MADDAEAGGEFYFAKLYALSRELAAALDLPRRRHELWPHILMFRSVKNKQTNKQTNDEKKRNFCDKKKTRLVRRTALPVGPCFVFLLFFYSIKTDRDPLLHLLEPKK